MSKPMAILVFSLAGLAVAATAGASGPPAGFNFFDHHDHDCPHGKCVAAAPEIDPASAMGALTLLGGGLLVLRGRSNKKK